MKKSFQERTTEEGRGLRVPLGIEGVGSPVVVVVVAWRTRQREGVKKDVGVEVGGGCEARAANLERDIVRVVVEEMSDVDDSERLGVAIEEVKKAVVALVAGR